LLPTAYLKWGRYPAIDVTAITHLPYTEQGLRFQIARNIQSLYKQHGNNNGHNTKRVKSEKHTINSIKYKLQSNNAIITKADKDNIILITYKQEYCKKIGEFIGKNNLLKVNNDPTKVFQKKVRNVLNECQVVIHKDERLKYINMNSVAPTIKGVIKIHKENAPIRPVINWRNAPAYKLAKILTKKLQTYIPLPYTFKVKNSVHLIEDLNKITFNSNLQLVSFDITNKYSNVPTGEVLYIFDFYV
jgi:hypothetical protein